MIVAGMGEHGVRRLVFTSAFGVGSTRRDTPVAPRPLHRHPAARYLQGQRGGRAGDPGRQTWTGRSRIPLVLPTGRKPVGTESGNACRSGGSLAFRGPTWPIFCSGRWRTAATSVKVYRLHRSERDCSRSWRCGCGNPLRRPLRVDEGHQRRDVFFAKHEVRHLPSAFPGSDGSAAAGGRETASGRPVGTVSR